MGGPPLSQAPGSADIVGEGRFTSHSSKVCNVSEADELGAIIQRVGTGRRGPSAESHELLALLHAADEAQPKEVGR